MPSGMSKTALLVAFFAVAPSVLAQGTQCGPKLAPCPSSAPCCSEYGFCNTNSICLGGCNPWWSHSLDSCRAMPICQDATYTFDQSSLVAADKYEGNSTLHAWTIDAGSTRSSTNKELSLVLTETNNGTRISSTRYVHYGTITATVKTGKWAGVVTAFITMSNVKDEIDWEWPGAKTTEAQSNFFFQGNVDYTAGNGQTHTGLTDTNANYHDYTIDWQPDTLRFLIDNKEVRSVNKKDTLKNGVFQYPTTPARIQLSIWPAGIPSMPQGTVQWAGGMINWQDPDYVANNNQFVATVSQVTVKCTDSLQITPNTISYVWGANDTSGVPTVTASNHTTLLNGAEGRFGVRPWTVVAVGAVLGYFTL